MLHTFLQYCLSMSLSIVLMISSYCSLSQKFIHRILKFVMCILEISQFNLAIIFSIIRILRQMEFYIVYSGSSDIIFIIFWINELTFCLFLLCRSRCNLNTYILLVFCNDLPVKKNWKLLFSGHSVILNNFCNWFIPEILQIWILQLTTLRLAWHLDNNNK